MSATAVAPSSSDSGPNPYGSLPQYQTKQGVVPLSDPLLESLKQYITSGQHAEHITAGQLQSIFEGATSGGRTGLETFLSECQMHRRPIWDHVLPMKGRVSTSKILLEFYFNIKLAPGEVGIPYRVQGSKLGIFHPWLGEVEYVSSTAYCYSQACLVDQLTNERSGNVYYHDIGLLMSSDAFEAKKDFMVSYLSEATNQHNLDCCLLSICQGHFTIKFIRNGVTVGTFVTSSETLPLPMGPVSGQSSWAQ